MSCNMKLPIKVSHKKWNSIDLALKGGRIILTVVIWTCHFSFYFPVPLLRMIFASVCYKRIRLAWNAFNVVTTVSLGALVPTVRPVCYKNRQWKDLCLVNCWHYFQNRKVHLFVRKNHLLQEIHRLKAEANATSALVTVCITEAIFYYF